jgi:hypothetical protein
MFASLGSPTHIYSDTSSWASWAEAILMLGLFIFACYCFAKWWKDGSDSRRL